MGTLTSSVAEMLPSLETVKDAYESKQWLLLIGLVLTGAVALARKLGLLNMLAPEHHKWAAMAMAMAGGVGGGLMMGVAWPMSLITGVSAGLVAVGGWETIGKWLRDRMPATKPKDGAI